VTGRTDNAIPPVIYVHPNGQPAPLTIPLGVLANFNALPGPKLGLYQFEMDDDIIRAARVVCLSLHWYMPMAALLPYCRYVKTVNPALKIVVGGLTANAFAQCLIRSGSIDYALVGDTEASFRALIDGILADRDEESLAAIPNVWSAFGTSQAPAVHDDASYASLNWLEHDWFPSLAMWTRWVHARVDADTQCPDHCFPTLPLMRGCRYPCQGCYGDYQRRFFQRPAVSLTRERLIADLDQIERAGYRFVVFTNGIDIFGILQQGFLGKRYDLEASIPICFLPELNDLRNLCDSFRRCRVKISYAEDDLMPNRLQSSIDDRFLDRFYDTFAAVERDNLEVVVSRVIESDDAKRVFEERLAREPIPSVRLMRKYDWIRPTPQGIPIGEERNEDEFAHFLGWSREFQNYVVASSLFPRGQEVFVAWHPLRPYDDPGVEAKGEWAAVQQALQRRYHERALPGVAELELQCHAIDRRVDDRGGGMGWCSSEVAGESLSSAGLQFDGHLPHFELRCPALGRVRDVVVVPRIRLEPGQEHWVVGEVGIRLNPPPVGEQAEVLDVAIGLDRVKARLLGAHRELLWAGEMLLDNPLAQLGDMISPQRLVDELLPVLDAACGSGPLCGWSIKRQANAPCRLVVEPPAGSPERSLLIVPRSVNSVGALSRLFAIQPADSGNPDVTRELVDVIGKWEEAAVLGKGQATPVVDEQAVEATDRAARLAEFLSTFLGDAATPFRLDADWSVLSAVSGRSEPLNHVILTCAGTHGAVDVRLEPMHKSARFFARTRYLTLSHVGQPMAEAELAGLMSRLKQRIAAAEQQLTPATVRDLMKALA